jgi:acyl-coenzyme A thioesterase PaaI-like protein
MGHVSQHILHDVALATRRDGEAHRATAEIAPTMWVPGTTNLRTSVLAVWTDVAAGRLVLDLIAPRVPVTLELDVHVHEPPLGTGAVHVVAQPVKLGRSVAVLTVDFTDDDGRPIAIGHASFMPAPDPNVVLSGERLEQALDLNVETSPSRLPLAERARLERREPGVVILPRSEDALNASNTLNGGLIAVAIEEAALSLAAPSALISSMALRYLRPVRIGPAIASAEAHRGLGRVEVRDAGADDRLAVVATTRTF